MTRDDFLKHVSECMRTSCEALADLQNIRNDQTERRVFDELCAHDIVLACELDSLEHRSVQLFGEIKEACERALERERARKDNS